MDFALNISRDAAERWQARQKQRRKLEQALADGRITDVESGERVGQRMRRLAETAMRSNRGRSAVLGPPGPSLVETVGLERVLGNRDFLGIDFLELALAVSRFVGRILVRTTSGRLVSYGTGFMVSPRLLMTNHHVFASADDAANSLVEFDYQQDRFRQTLPVKTFALAPSTFFLTDETLDFSLVAVAEQSREGALLADYAWTRLIGEQGKALLGDPLNIVQHPRGRVKEIVLRSNKLVDLFDHFAHYETDTEPGSSGAPVFNDQWEVVALHHSGVPAMKDGNYLAQDGTIWKDGMSPSLLLWVANEGIRVSSLVHHLRETPLEASEARHLRDELLELEPPHPMEVMARSEAGAPARPSTGSSPPSPHLSWNLPRDGSSTPAPEPPAGMPVTLLPITLPVGSGLPADSSTGWTIPLAISLTLGAPRPPADPAALAGTGSPGGTGTAGQAPRGADGVEIIVEEGVSIDPDYSRREGYDVTFLGSDHPVPLPGLGNGLEDLAAINREAAEGALPYELPYHHFSVVMNRERRLAFFTAVNIDGGTARRPRRKGDRWFLDPRIGGDEQATGAIYAANPLDKGHLVRRLDPAWGTSKTVARIANDDTFHYTNAAPQHAGFNRDRTSWAGVEDYILGNADRRDLKVSVFTGPVFRDDDPAYRGVRLPRQFWKVVAMVKTDGQLSATGYLLSQASLIEGLAEEAFAFGAWRTFQVPVGRIGELTGLDFGDLPTADPLVGSLADSESLEAGGPGVREILSFEELTL